MQVAISLVLLVGAGLFLRTLHNLRQVDVGFNPQNLLLFRVNPQLNRYDEKRQIALYTQLLERIAAVPGVRGVALSNPALLSGSVNIDQHLRPGRVYAPGQRDYDNSINRLVISPNFFEMMEIPMLLGPRLHAARQRDGAEGRRDQRGGGEEVLPQREPDRPALRLERRDHRPARDRRRAARRQIQQRARSGAADDVRAVPADARRQRR